MYLNAQRAISRESTGEPHPFFDNAWREQISLLAQRLNWRQLKKVTDAYDSALRADENAIDAYSKAK